MRIVCSWCWVLVVFVIAVGVAAAEQQRQQEGEHILSRKRRYLIFPEGSSFQLVYDQIIPIVDYTNFLIFGVTTALAWPLPDKPIDDGKLREMFTNGTLIPFRRIDDNVNDNEIDDADAAASADASNELAHRPQGVDSYYRRPPNVAASRPYDQQQQPINQLYDRDDRYYTDPRRPPTKTQYNRFGLSEQLDRYSSNGAKGAFRPWTKNAGWSKQQPARPIQAAQRRHHMIYPALGKRSVRQIRQADSARPSIEHLSLLHHRHTRHSLYASVERYWEAHGRNGEACVRRALCETQRRRRREAAEPGSFVGELLRVVFSLPDVARHARDHERLRREDGYHEAAHGGHEDESGLEDCGVRYAACGESLWDSVYAK